jgi:hypothetical protein
MMENGQKTIENNENTPIFACFTPLVGQLDLGIPVESTAMGEGARTVENDTISIRIRSQFRKK